MNARLEILGDGIKGRKYSPDLAQQVNQDSKSEEKRGEPQTASVIPSSSKPQLVYPTFPLQLQIMKPLKLENYIILPGAKHGDYEYCPMLISMKRDNHDFTWEDAHIAMTKRGARMLTLRQYVDFFNMLKDENVPLVNGIGQDIAKEKGVALFDEITVSRSSYKKEWVDVAFKNVNGILNIQYNHISKFQPDGSFKLEPLKVEPLENCLQEDKAYNLTEKGVGALNFEHWIQHATKHGLPPADIPIGKKSGFGLHYNIPREGKHYAIGVRTYPTEEKDRFYVYPHLKTLPRLGLDAFNKPISLNIGNIRPAFPIIEGENK